MVKLFKFTFAHFSFHILSLNRIFTEKKNPKKSNARLYFLNFVLNITERNLFNSLLGIDKKKVLSCSKIKLTCSNVTWSCDRAKET